KLSQALAFTIGTHAGSLDRDRRAGGTLRRAAAQARAPLAVHPDDDDGRADDRRRPVDDARGSGLAELGAAGVRGTVPVPALAAAPAARAACLRHVDGGQSERGRLLPRPVAGRDPLARPAAAVSRVAAGRLRAAAFGEAARTAAPSLQDP